MKLVMYAVMAIAAFRITVITTAAMTQVSYTDKGKDNGIGNDFTKDGEKRDGNQGLGNSYTSELDDDHDKGIGNDEDRDLDFGEDDGNQGIGNDPFVRNR